MERQNQREKDSVKDYGFQNLELHNHLSKVNENTRDYLPGRYCNGVMGVPITFLDKFNADQFKISGCADANVLPDGWRGASKEFVELYYKQGNTGQYKEGNRLACYIDKNGKAKVPYKKILIQKKV